ncbi:MAG: hypothetical protein M3R44_00780 [Candidatus Eremiobacteraeota bacterium]|nr:hypothetical protein [Candidatus Eremiobacteraeota bacterium]
MIVRRFHLAMSVCVLTVLLAPCVVLAQAQTSYTVALHVDASHATQGLLRVHETMNVPAGALTLVYPKWIPGEFAPNGPIPNVADLVVNAGGKALRWDRDSVDMYAFHVDVPADAGPLTVDFTFLGGPAPGFDTARLATPNILSLEWNKVALTPFAASNRSVTIAPSIRLPSADWKFATALEMASQRGAEVAFKPVTLNVLVDSPLDAGTNARMFAMGTWNGVPLTLAAFADTPEELAVDDKTIGKFRNLVEQMHALYRNRHFNHYTFLLTLTDQMPGEGLEHHQSSDNGSGGDMLTDPAALTANADLLAHEFNHSWDGKYRRAADNATPNFQVPEIDDLLWVYEGMTQFYGELQAERAGLRTEQQWLDGLASTYAYLDHESGRTDDPLIDTAVASSIRRGIRPWSAERRSQDYYTEGELTWLEADVLIRNLSHGARSLDDVARAFFGAGHDTGPSTVTYTRDDIVAALNAGQPYDWKRFLDDRVYSLAPHPPNPFAQAGYRLVYRATPSAYARLIAAHRKSLDMWYSLGISATHDGTIIDVSTDSPAGRAGIGPGMKIAAIDGRELTGQEQIDAALRTAENGTALRLLLVGGGVYRTVALDYRGGPRYPQLERAPGTADVLGAIAKPLAAP